MSFRVSNVALDDTVLDELVTIRDWLRFAVSRFEAAGLVYGHGTSTALDEAAFLILHTLHLPIDQLEPFVDARLSRPERIAVRDIIQARITTRKPAPYLTNEAWIQGQSFYVDERVIVPRSFIGEMLGGGLAGLVNDAGAIERVLDLCTGSGCLAVLAALAFPNARVDAVDISADALAVAARNVGDYGLQNRVTLHCGDLFEPLQTQRYDLILTNPPYVDAPGMAALPPEYAHEPVLALAAGQDGLDIARRIIATAPVHLQPGGGLLMEIGRCRPAFESAFPNLEPIWIETEASLDEVLWLTAGQLGSGTGMQLRERRKRVPKQNDKLR
jgi:ribosomal protein L3 glutamine methyltransferase